jgi:tetratricopeptide (TPR) repeat protein
MAALKKEGRVYDQRPSSMIFVAKMFLLEERLAMLFNDLHDRAASQWATWGEHLLQRGNAEDALWNFQGALSVARQLLKNEPGSVLRTRDVAECWDRVGYAHQTLGEPIVALEAYSEALKHRTYLSRFEARYGPFTRDMALGMARFAALFAFEGDKQIALRMIEQSVAICRMRDALKSDDAQRLSDLAKVLRVSARILKRAGFPLWSHGRRLEARGIEFRMYALS